MHAAWCIAACSLQAAGSSVAIFSPDACWQGLACSASAGAADSSGLDGILRSTRRSQGCLEGGCELCAQNPSRRCSDNFSAKYLSGDSLLARCGAAIRVEVIDRVTGDAVHDESLASLQLEVLNSPQSGWSH